MCHKSTNNTNTTCFQLYSQAIKEHVQHIQQHNNHSFWHVWLSLGNTIWLFNSFPATPALKTLANKRALSTLSEAFRVNRAAVM